MIPAWYVLALAGAFLLFSIFQTATHARERRDLYNRLMARDLSEYSNLTRTDPGPRGRNTILRNLKNHEKSKEPL